MNKKNTIFADMKKLVLFLIALLPVGFLFAQISMQLNFDQNNLIPGSNTFKCEGSFTYLTINTIPADTIYSVTLLKNGVVLEQGNYNSINSQSPGYFSLDSLIYAGSYELTVVSNTSNITFIESFSFDNPAPLSFNYTTNNPQPCVSYGEIQISAISGGTPPYSLGNINAQGDFDPIYLQNSFLTEDTLEDLNAGFYSVTLQDFYGCLFTVGSGGSPIEIAQGSDPLSIVSVEQQDSVRICTQGGLSPLSYILNGDTLISNDNCVSYALCEGNYNFLVFDANNVSACSDSVDIVVDAIDGFIEQESSTMIVQSGGTRPFSYSWTKDNVIQDGQTDSVYQGNLCPASYTCTIIDKANCSNSFDLTIDEIESNLLKEMDCFDKDFSVIETSVAGGTPPYAYLWNTKETTSSITNLSPQTYSLLITDNNGCQLTDQLEVPVINDSCLFNAFSPNGDLVNDTWVVNPSFLYEDSEVTIYNRWGAKIYESKGYAQAWDGKNSSGNLVKEGVYFYSIVLNNGYEKIKGSLSVFY